MFVSLRNWKVDYRYVLLIIIIGGGLGLRIYQLGEDPFWVDEFGVATAAFQSSIADAVSVAQTHIMAMPLDYIVAWCVARFSHDEAILRLPAALWGTASLAAGYYLFTELSNRKEIALFATFLMAVSPILIKYSQELRFYAPLVFFYLFATGLGIRALRRPSPGIWLSYTVTIVLGLFFHFYTLFVLCNIVILYLITFRGHWFSENRFSFFALSSLITVLGFIIGLINFGSVFRNPVPLQLYEKLDTFLLMGLGWMPPYPGETLTFVWGIICAIFALLGMFASLRKNSSSKSSVLIYSIAVQICAIIFFDIRKNYFLSARQLLMLVPLVLFYTASGVSWMIDGLSKRRKLNKKLSHNALWLFVVIVFTLSAIPAVFGYYRFKKGSVEEIIAALSQSWQPEEKIVIVPSYNHDLFTYYAQEEKALSQAMEPMDFTQTTLDILLLKDIRFIVIKFPVEDWVESILVDAEFTPLYISPNKFLYPQMLWYKD